MAGCAPASNETTAHVTNAITAGVDDDADESSIWIVAKIGGSTGYCSGVVVSPHVVLTAAHCSSLEGTYSVFLGADYNDAAAKALPTNYVPVAERRPHPKYDAKRNTDDIGVLVTSEAIPRAPARINREAIGKEDVGRPVRVVGHGQTDGGTNKTYGRRHAGTTALTEYDETSLTFAGLPGVCFFDSGGPTFMARGGRDVVVGIHSLLESASCEGQAWDTRVDAYADFVDAATRAIDPVVDPPSAEVDAGAADPSPDLPSAAPAPPSGCAVGRGRAGASYAVCVALVVVLMRVRRRLRLR